MDAHASTLYYKLLQQRKHKQVVYLYHSILFPHSLYQCNVMLVKILSTECLSTLNLKAIL